MEAPASAQEAEHIEDEEAGGKCEQSFSTTMDMGELFLVSKKESVVVLYTGAAADLVRTRWLAHHNRLLERF